MSRAFAIYGAVVLALFAFADHQGYALESFLAGSRHVTAANTNHYHK